MTKTIRTLAKTTAIAIAAFGMAGSAQAGSCSSGFLADLACQAGLIDQDTAQSLDAANKALGQPVDQAVYAGMDYVVPGSGTAARGYAQLQQRGSRGNRGGPAPQYQPAPQPQYNQQYNQPYYQQSAPQYGQMQPGVPAYGSYAPPVVQTYQCNTPQGSALVGYLMNPGTPCTVQTAWGPVHGIAGF